ncbi:stalk domain-containing protein [Paenibacillus piri]|uniref:Copper amine oxidase-like N-terminal domain-containing protein n=1 Tax=Paenibacillus piri TaxID=2547395 RepID=A0A4R5L076_9BACL|nr:stalk domain-containing protein [Paenibacillus piri]TDG00741.1 hypothetical protein E1757_03720 [Paenibacillus piri]
MRKFILGLGCGLLFSATSMVYASSETIQAILNKTTFDINGKEVAVGEEYGGVINYNGHIYVPIRFAAEHLRSAVGYDSEKQQVIIKNDGSTIYDTRYQSIALENLIATKEGNDTRVSGQIKSYNPSVTKTIDAKLSFYNQDGAKIGEASFSAKDFEDEPKSFETVGVGDFRNYAKVEVDIEAVNSRKIVADPDPNEPEVSFGQIVQKDMDKVDKLAVAFPGKKEVLFYPGEEVFQTVMNKVTKLKLKKAVDQSPIYGYAYRLVFYIGEERFEYLNNLHIGNSRESRYVPTDLTKDLDDYIKQNENNILKQ